MLVVGANFVFMSYLQPIIEWYPIWYTTVMKVNRMQLKTKIFTTAAVGLLIFAGYCFKVPIWEMGVHTYDVLTDKEAIQSYILSWGMAAPFVFTGIQILQVVLAPIPGEVTGFIGGFLFGTLNGFLYSSIGLTVGSLINFGIGRLLGKQFIRKLIPASQVKQLDKLVHRQGAIVLFICFLFPGFPKDYLCLFLGISDIPFKLFFVMTTFGRMPGTLALSIQGASLYQQQYVLMTVIMAICFMSAWLSYRYKDDLYLWMDKMNGKSNS
jgi:uncharacterized membrane protein YdjX (TVP38/TMEM64 family)